MASQETMFVVGTAILAAGASTRMGKNKLLLPWGDTSVIGQLLRQWTRFSTQVAVVHGPASPELQSELDRLNFPASDRVLNPNPAAGMLSSVRTAASWRGWGENLSHFVLTLGDQPHLRDDTLEAVLQHAAAVPEKIWQPAQGGRLHHPIVFPAKFWRALATASGPTLKDFLEAHSNARSGCAVADHGLPLDMDTPADYERLRPGEKAK